MGTYTLRMALRSQNRQNLLRCQQGHKHPDSLCEFRRSYKCKSVTYTSLRYIYQGTANTLTSLRYFCMQLQNLHSESGEEI
jgi:hypothetical protein